MSETHLQQRAVRAINRASETRAIRARLVGRVGFPDVLGCQRGRMFTLEAKLPGQERRLTKMQERELALWGEAGAIVGVFTSVEEALGLLEGGEGR